MVWVLSTACFLHTLYFPAECSIVDQGKTRSTEDFQSTAIRSINRSFYHRRPPLCDRGPNYPLQTFQWLFSLKNIYSFKSYFSCNGKNREQTCFNLNILNLSPLSMYRPLTKREYHSTSLEINLFIYY